MELNRVVIVYKASLARASTDRTSKGKRSSTSVSEYYTDLVKSIQHTVEKSGIKARCIDRSKLKKKTKSDLIVSVGGDGTFLAASHVAGKTPIIGVNFLPNRSVGFYCAADPKNFGRVFKELIADKLTPLELPLLKVFINGRQLKVMALNEALFASPSPAEMSRYKLKIGRTVEYQRSSGVWIAAGPGSTAAMASAGGNKLKINSPQLQYLIREPCPMPGEKYELIRGILGAGQPVRVTSQMPDSFVYLDGPDTAYPIPYGLTLTVKVVPDALKVFL
jgi:NAD+ kinase